MDNKNTYKKIETWSVINALSLSIASIIALVMQQLYVLIIVFSISIWILITIHIKALLKTKPIFGIANSITLFRILIIGYCFLDIDYNNTSMLCLILSIAVILDFFDGKAARYFNESSYFGQYFDMETDAFYVLIMSIYYYLFQDLPFWILIPGLLRYVFRLYTFCFPKPNIKEEKKRYATIIAASYFIILLLGLVLNDTIQYIALLLGSLAIVISFSIGILQYHKQ